MAELRRIRDHVDITLTDDALGSDSPQDYVRIREDIHTERINPPVILDKVDQLVHDTVTAHDAYDASMDRVMAIPLHTSLMLSRRQAADRRLWAWMGVCRYPHFVCHRWQPSRHGPDGERLRNQDRFSGNRVRQTFARLWWAAELTAGDGGDYSLTEQFLALPGFQDVYEAIFGRAFCGYRPAIDSFVDVVGRYPEVVIRETAKEFGYVLTTTLLESMDRHALDDLLSGLVQQVETRRANR